MYVLGKASKNAQDKIQNKGSIRTGGEIRDIIGVENVCWKMEVFP